MGRVCLIWVGFATCGSFSHVGWICQIWGAVFVISGWDLFICGGGLSYMDGVCHIWAGFVTLRGLSFFLSGFVKYGRD